MNSGLYQPPPWQPQRKSSGPYQPPQQFPPWQQLPNQPQWQQPLQYPPYQQQYYQPPPFYPPPSMVVKPPPKRRSSCLVATLACALICVACGLLSVIINPLNSASTDPGIIQTTTIPSTKALNQYKAAPILGSDVSVFLAKYGEPDVKVNNIDYVYTSQGLVVLIDAGATRRVNAIQRSQINGFAWDRDQAKATCLPYMPSDAQFKRTLTIYEKNKKIAIDYVFVYFSSSLAKRLPASDFMDQNFKYDKPGTFVLGLSYKPGSTKAFNDCFVATSMQKEIRK